MKLFKTLMLITLLSSMSMADLDYYSTLGTNRDNSGPKVVTALIVSGAVFFLFYWLFVERYEIKPEKTSIHYK